MKFDEEVINSRIEKIRSNLTHLEKYGKMSYKEFSSDIEHIATAERLLQVSIEAMLDIGNHIIATAGFEEPKEYRDIFLILGRRNVLNNDLVKRTVDMVGLRNRLVHGYIEVDNKKLYKFVTNELNDFTEFIKQIYDYVHKK